MPTLKQPAQDQSVGDHGWSRVSRPAPDDDDDDEDDDDDDDDDDNDDDGDQGWSLTNGQRCLAPHLRLSIRIVMTPQILT